LSPKITLPRLDRGILFAPPAKDARIKSGRGEMDYRDGAMRANAQPLRKPFDLKAIQRHFALIVIQMGWDVR
jgi:hypothetical protein